jgi:hypothetical protein
LCRTSEYEIDIGGSIIIEQIKNDLGTLEEAVTTYKKDVERLARGLIKMRMNYKEYSIECNRMVSIHSKSLCAMRIVEICYILVRTELLRILNKYL